MRFQDRLIVDVDNRSISVINPVRLTDKEYTLLMYFISNIGKIVTAQQICKALNSCDFINNQQVGGVVHTLRRKIELTPRNPTIIQTIRPSGYVFCPEGYE